MDSLVGDMSDLFTRNLIQSKSIQRLLDGIKTPHAKVLVTGTWGSLNAQLINIVDDDYKNGLIIASTDLEAKKIAEDIRAMGKEIMYFPAKEIFFFDVYATSHDYIFQRIAVLNELSNRWEDKNRNDILIVTTTQALLQPVPSRELWENSKIVLEVGKNVNLTHIMKSLVNMGYERVDKVETEGHFSVRGGILDIYQPNSSPIRIEFFDDEVDSIRIFDPSTQLSVKTQNTQMVYPCRDMILTEDNHRIFCNNLQNSVKKISDSTQKEALKELIINLQNNNFVDGIQRYMSLVPDHNNSLLSYMNINSPVYISSLTKVLDRFKMQQDDFHNRFYNHFERGALLSEQIHLIMSYSMIIDEIKKYRLVLMDHLNTVDDTFTLDESIAIPSMEAPLFNSGSRGLEDLISEIKTWSKNKYRIIMAVSSEKNQLRLQKSLLEYNISSTKWNDKEDMSDVGIIICTNNISHGFILRDISWVLLTDKELFGMHKKTRHKKRKMTKVIKSFNELSVGDYVVHEEHGIGRYDSIEQLEVDGQKKDYMKIAYSGDDRLYIPVENMDLIQKYVGKEVSSLRLSKLGGVEWKNAKLRAKKHIEDMTDELLELYAARKATQGYAYGEDTEWQKQLEDMFPYEETPDQIRCIDEIKKDMQQSIPMERLLCGDVGYGKTEVAIRAIFKAAMESKQIVFLVPTTLLAKQHYDRLRTRFSKFPIKVEMLSRFRSTKEQKKIVEDIRTGVIDIIIGTHRVLSKDVIYKDLGLLIIDEEQRFGVKHKEKIKTLKKGIDVLSLTATPIPRTLHMSMIGIRDMSIIEDPPDNRYPVQTYVTGYDENLIMEAIQREIDRGGQVFFVHNRVKDIDGVASSLQRLMPDIKIRVAHGQMSEVLLEKIMMGFLEHEFDVLVCTTIIETGLDISNVNTMIVNHADKMGLAQLYQLRGRVGRSSRVAYAYLMYSRNKVLSEIAQKRLQAVKAFTELGSGFKIAMKDLEIRGTGNILGASQSGHMASVGYEMFVKMLEEKVSEIKGDVNITVPETSVEYNISAYIPAEYVPNPQQKIELYKKIASIRNKEDAFSLEEEIEDRYGTLPQVVYNLINVSYLKALGKMAGANCIKENEKDVGIYWEKASDLKAESIILATHDFGKDIQINAGDAPNIRYKLLKKETPIKKLSKVIVFMEKMVEFQHTDY